MALDTKDKTNAASDHPTAPPLTILMDNNNLLKAIVPDAIVVGAGAAPNAATTPINESQSNLSINNKTYGNSKKCKHKLPCLSTIILLIFCCILSGLEVSGLKHYLF